MTVGPAYDATGRQIEEIAQLGRVTTKDYEAACRMTGEQFNSVRRLPTTFDWHGCAI